MMKPTMREHLAETFPSGVEDVPHEQIAWAIGDWLSCHGTEWTLDDRAAVREIGENPNDYMCFDEEQEGRIDEVYDLTAVICELMTTPLRDPAKPKGLPAGVVREIAYAVADMLANAGCEVYFPIHVETDTHEYISDMFE